MLKVKAESFQFSVKDNSCNYIMMKRRQRVKLGNAEALGHLYRLRNKTSTRTSGKRDGIPQIGLDGNPATETLRFSRKGPSDWPAVGHVWK